MDEKAFKTCVFYYVIFLEKGKERFFFIIFIILEEFHNYIKCFSVFFKEYIKIFFYISCVFHIKNKNNLMTFILWKMIIYIFNIIKNKV